MNRYARRYLVWLVLLMGCTSQPFCDFRDTAPIVVIPTPENYTGGGNYGSVMVPLFIEEEGQDEPNDYVAVTAGKNSQVEVVRLSRGEDLDIVRSTRLSNICDDEDLDDERSTCYQRLPGAGLAYRSWWGNSLTDPDRGEECVAVGMAGRDQAPGLGFWCAQGTRHQRQAFFLATPQRREVKTLGHVLRPEERLFVGTEEGLFLLDHEAVTLDRVIWEAGGDLPSQNAPVEVISTFATDAVDAGYLVALGFPEQGRVLVGSVASDDDADDNAVLTPYDCIAMDLAGFGSVVELNRLSPDGDPVLLTGIDWEHREEVPNPEVWIFDLELDGDPTDVTCRSPVPAHTLACDNSVAEDAGLDVDCEVQPSGFGAAISVGNIDDTPANEVIIGAPGARADGFDRAGAGYVFRPSVDGRNALAVLIDSVEERGGHRLGAGVLVAPVGGRDEVIMAAPGDLRLVMFLCTGVGNSAPLWDSPYDANASWEDRRCRNPER